MSPLPNPWAHPKRHILNRVKNTLLVGNETLVYVKLKLIRYNYLSFPYHHTNLFKKYNIKNSISSILTTGTESNNKIILTTWTESNNKTKQSPKITILSKLTYNHKKQDTSQNKISSYFDVIQHLKRACLRCYLTCIFDIWITSKYSHILF